MRINYKRIFLCGEIMTIAFGLSGCTVKAVGDPNRPITINAHVTIDIKGLKDTATDIEDYVSGQKPKKNLPRRQSRHTEAGLGRGSDPRRGMGSDVKSESRLKRRETPKVEKPWLLGHGASPSSQGGSNG